MEQNKIIIELLERVINLEKEVEDLKKSQELRSLEINKKEDTITTKTRKDFRKDVIEKLKEHNIDKHNFRPATRSEGSGIAYNLGSEFGKDKVEAYKLYTSTGNSWFRIEKEEVEKIINGDSLLKGIIFYTYIKDDFNIILVLNGKDLEEVINEKGKDNYDKKGGYHFYINRIEDRKGNVKIIDDRDKENIMDLTKYNNKFVLE